MNKKVICALSLLFLYSIVLTHSVIPHHHHDANSIKEYCHNHSETENHNDHITDDNNSGDREACYGFCLFSFHNHNHENCKDACNFLIEIFKRNSLNNSFVLSNEIIIQQLPIEYKKLCIYTSQFINTELYYTFAALRAPPIA